MTRHGAARFLLLLVVYYYERGVSSSPLYRSLLESRVVELLHNLQVHSVAVVISAYDYLPISRRLLPPTRTHFELEAPL